MPIFTVESDARLFDYLEKALHGAKRSTLKNYLRFQAVFVNGKPVSRFDHPLKPGDQVTVEKDKQKSEVNRLRSDLKIVYEDDTLLVIDKPSGLLTIATEKIKTQTAFYQANEYLKAKLGAGSPRPAKGAVTAPLPSKLLFIVHRLDKDASGLLIFAKAAAAKFYLQEHWHQFEKKYYAVVEGTPRQPSGEIASFLKETKILRVFSSKESSEGAKFSRTEYRVLQSEAKRSLLEVTLKTGRKHQIRVHLASIGHPVLGDKDYGHAALAKRLALHAFYLSVTHPVTQQKISFHTEIPTELALLCHPRVVCV